MFRNRISRNQALATQAFESLATAIESAGQHTRSASRELRSRAGGRVGSGAKEARRRANNALDALAGKRPRTPWGALAMVAALGAAVGWVATTFGRGLAPTFNKDLADITDDTPADLTSLRH
jgi:hypothetical protein